MADKETKLSIVVDAKNKTEKAFSAVKDNLSAIKKNNEGLITSMKTVGKIGTVAFGAITAVIGVSVKSAQEAEKAMASMNATLKAMNLGSKFDETKKKILETADAAVRLGFDDEQAALSVTKLFQATKNLTEAQKLHGFAMDLSRAKNIDLDTATRAVVLAMQGNMKVLKEFVPALDETKRPMDAITLGMQALTGQAQAFADTGAGKIEIFNQELDNLKQTIGEQFAPILTQFVSQITEIVKKMNEWAEANPELVDKIVKIGFAVSGILAVMLPLGMALPGIVLAFKGLGAVLAFVATGPGLAITALMATIIALGINVTKQIMSLSGHWNEVWLGMKLVLLDVAEFISKVFLFIPNVIIKAINFVIDKVNSVLETMSKMPFVGKQFNKMKLGKLDELSLDNSIDALRDQAVNKFMTNPQPVQQNTINIVGNTMLDADVAEQMGDLIMGKLKLSSNI